ncbi:MAG: hypothetical protein COC01_07240 [Bacteroidetes bacterium]|nr:MAG: hypothetical protein COC01_07240 [Bacteroidota bacterium]
MFIKVLCRSYLALLSFWLYGCGNEPINPNLLTIEILIQETDFEILKSKREEALEIGMLISNTRDLVDAQILINDSSYNARIRLKGDWLDHLENDKWSFRINLKGKTWNGLDEFSIHAPKIRSNLDEYVLHQFCVKEGILAPKYEFVNVVLNHDTMGLYALEEHFDQQMLVNNNRDQGVIVKFSENGLWKRRRETGKSFESFNESFEKAEIRAFSMKQIEKDTALNIQFQKAKDLLEKYQSSNFTASDIFNLPVLARYYAITDILRSHHATIWHNMRFYFDPTVNLLEPVMFDGYTPKGIDEPWYHITHYHFARNEKREQKGSIYDSEKNIFTNDEFVRHYKKELNRMTKRDYLETILNNILIKSREYQKAINLIDEDYNYDIDYIYNNAKKIRKAFKFE